MQFKTTRQLNENVLNSNFELLHASELGQISVIQKLQISCENEGRRKELDNDFFLKMRHVQYFNATQKDDKRFNINKALVIVLRNIGSGILFKGYYS